MNPLTVGSDKRPEAVCPGTHVLDSAGPAPGLKHWGWVLQMGGVLVNILQLALPGKKKKEKPFDLQHPGQFQAPVMSPDVGGGKGCAVIPHCVVQ